MSLSFFRSKKGKGTEKVSILDRATRGIARLGNNKESNQLTGSAPKLTKEPKLKKVDVERAEFGLITLYDGDSAEIDIVAVHGLNGHRERTFTADNGTCWLTSLLPSLIPNVRVLSYGYDARTHSSSPLSSEHLLGHAEDFLETLTMERILTETTKRPIIFVAHSLGGIIVKSTLNLSAGRNASHREVQRDIQLSTYGILFMGTPHRGGNGVSWANMALNMIAAAQYTNTEILNHLEQNSEWLENQQTMYLPISSRFNTTYFYERYPTVIAGQSVIVVPKYSAYLGLSDAAVFGINSNHSDMVKYRTAEEEGFKRVGGTLRIMLKTAAEKVNENWQIEEAVKEIGKAQKISYIIPMRLPFLMNHNFTGRRKELLKIHEELQGVRSDASASHLKVVVLHGLGGIGKTQLATQYAYLHENDYTSIWWANAKSTETLSRSFFGIAQEIITHHARIRVHTGQKPDYPWIATALGLPYDAISPTGQLVISQDSMKLAIDAVKAWLAAEENSKWLLIIDNYDDLENVDTRGFLPTNSSGSIIITTRATETQRLGKSIEIVEVLQEDAMEILRKSAQTDLADFETERNDALAIIEKVGALPLALDQAGAFISKMQIPYSEYLSRFDTRFAELAAKRPPTSVWDYREDTVFTTWEISFNALGKASQELLMLCAFLDNEDIWEGLFSPAIVEEKFGIAKRRRSNKDLGSSFWIHPMVHKWSCERLDRAKREVQALGAVSLVSAAVSFDHGRDELRKMTLQLRLMQHIAVCFNHICNDEYLEPVKTDSGQLREVDVLGGVLRYHWKSDQAEGLSRWTLARRELALGKDHPDTLSNIQDMALILDDQGKYEDSLYWYRKALAGQEKILENDHPDILNAINGAGIALYRLGKYDDALEWYKRALVGRETVMGKDHSDSIDTIANIALVFLDQGQYNDSLEWFSRALSGYERILGEDHPFTLNVIHRMASVFEKQGKYDDAFKWYKRALAKKEKALGKDHPDTLATVNGMALVFNRQGKYEDAIEWYRRAFTGCEKALGKSHPDTLTTASGVASMLEKQMQYEDSLKWYKRSLTGYEETVGRDHPYTLITAHNIGYVLDKQGKDDDALEWYKRALAGRAKDHPDTPGISAKIASVFNKQGKYDDAIEWYNGALAGQESLLGKDHPETLDTVSGIALLFDTQGKYDKALEWYTRAFSGYEKALGKDHPYTLATAQSIGYVFDTQERYSDALEWYKRVLTGKEKGSPDTLNSVSCIASVFDKQGNYEEAFGWYTQAFSGYEKALGVDHPYTLTISQNLAFLFDKQGRYDDALEWYKRTLAGKEVTLGKDHPETNEARGFLTEIMARRRLASTLDKKSDTTSHTATMANIIKERQGRQCRWILRKGRIRPNR